MKHMLQAFLYYKKSFSGFTKEVWWLALASLINRAGAMVLPFLSIYLTSALGFEMGQVGIVMLFYGMGSFCGAWIGGELSTHVGAYKTMIGSLVLGGICFYFLGYFQTLEWFCAGMFVTAMVIDVFRPAVFVALADYAVPENRTRAITLIRLAINLGFSVGPALGGLIIVGIGYQYLFVVDAVTCIAAGVLIWVVLPKKEARPTSEKIARHSHKKIMSDYPFMFFLVAVLLFSFVFVQYFSAIPVYYKDIRMLTEDQVGWLLSINGALIFLIEMPLIYALDSPNFSKFKIIAWSSVLLSLSFWLMWAFDWNGILVAGMLVATVAEMLCFPLTNSISMQRGTGGNEARYMAYYTMTFSLSHTFGHFLGLNMSAQFGFDTLLLTLTMLALIAGVLFLLVEPRFKSKLRR